MPYVPERVGRLLVTGYPGWLTEALLGSLETDALPGLQSLRLMVHPSHGRSLAKRAQRPWPIEYVFGDLSDGECLAEAAHGIDAVLHCAGILHVRRTRDWYEVNARVTESLVRAAVAAGVRRFVFISSNAAAGRSSERGRLLTEEDRPRPLSHYGRSKLLGEESLMRCKDRIEAVVLRPSMFYGPPVPLRHVEVYSRIVNGRMPLVGGGEFDRSLTYIDNLVQAVRLALVHPAAAGEVYFVSDKPVYTTREVTQAMACALDVRARFIPLPRFVAPLAYAIDSALASIGCYWQSVHLVGEADWHVGVSCEKARRQLGYEPTVELHEGMRRAVEWCRATGTLRSSPLTARGR